MACCQCVRFGDGCQLNAFATPLNLFNWLLRSLFVAASTSGDEFVRVLDLIHPTVQGDFGAAQTEIFDLVGVLELFSSLRVV